MFTRRTQWNRVPNRLSEAWDRRRTDPGAVDLTESNPTRCGLAYPETNILHSLTDPRALRYEPLAAGSLEARVAICRHLDDSLEERGDASDERRPPADPQSLVLTSSTSEGYAWLFKLLCERGDQVLIPRPSYPLLDFLAELEEVDLIPYPLHYTDRWHVDLDSLGASVTSRTRAIIVIHPNNPTGNLLSTTEARELRTICMERGIALISDEVFLDYPLTDPDRPQREQRASAPGSRHDIEPAEQAATATGTRPAPTSLSGSLAEDPPCLTFTLGGLSKSVGLPQMKVGWIRAAGPSGLAREARERLEVIADTYLSVNIPAQVALPALLQHGAEVRRAIRTRIQENHLWLAGRWRADPDAPWRLLRAEGGWSVVLQVPRTRSEEEWCLSLVEEAAVRVHPGYFFDFEEEGVLILSLLPEGEAFRRGVERLLLQVGRG